MKTTHFFIYLFIALLLINQKSLAWIYPEHRDITLLAIQKLPAGKRIILDELWKAARKGYENRLTDFVIDTTSGEEIIRLDFASWPAISGDHSCSAADLLEAVLREDWIIGVANVAAQLKDDLAKFKGDKQSQRINALRNSDLMLQRIDLNYATRAGSNNVHFLLALSDLSITLKEYLYKCCKEGAATNAISTFARYHYSAICKMHMLHSKILSESERSDLILSALADEAFALHFLEDIFASGHVAGTWGDASQRKGTHDYYNEKGLKTNTWEGESIILMGDAYMRKEDADKASAMIKLSLEQFLDSAIGNQLFNSSEEERDVSKEASFNVCITDTLPSNKFTPLYFSQLEKIFIKTPVPGLTGGLGELPRFRAEIGLFTGLGGSLNSTFLSRGFGVNQKYFGFISGVQVLMKFGVGLDGVLNESGDGLIFGALGEGQDGSASSGIANIAGSQAYGTLLSSIPARSFFLVMLRVPFYLIPGDLLVAGPILMILSPNTLTKMAVASANGGVIPWQAGISTSFGRFQFILGREVGVYFYGTSDTMDIFFQTETNSSGEIGTVIAAYRSTRIEFGILEYRPFRSFSFNQSSKIFLQLYGGVDIPHRVEVVAPEGSVMPKTGPIWYIGIRSAFDWRYYF
jgi:hypothetical protein